LPLKPNVHLLLVNRRRAWTRSRVQGVSKVGIDSGVLSGTGDPGPDSEFLGGLRVEKTQGPSQLRLADDRWLELTGFTDDLEQLGKALSGLEDGNHHQWYTSPVSLIIEADEWRANSENSSWRDLRSAFSASQTGQKT
jgi:hypothetical protein